MVRLAHTLNVMMMSAVMTAATLEEQFRELPKEACRNTGPLFWLHGDETPERLNAVLDKVAEGGNGCFTAESRPHKDWLGEGWYRDLGVCLDAAKRLDLKMWIFDEDWWPSQTVAGKVPQQCAAKKLAGKAEKVTAGGTYQGTPGETSNFIALVAGRLDADGAVEADTLRDLTSLARKGPVRWTPPADGKAWQVMTFSWGYAPTLKQGNRLAVDGMSRDCVEWYIRTVYEAHHARFGKDFGTTIPGYFYDEPETPGDWGTEFNATFKSRGADWMPAYVAWTFKLAGEAQSAAKYQYAEARAETWGRTMFGGLSEWCRKRGVLSIGHFMEHGMLYVNNDYCAGDMMLLQKYSDMGGIDLVCRQMYPGQRPHDIYQTPKLASSISHVYGKDEDLAMCEIFGGYNQVLTYPEMKWLCDQHQLRGINFMIPHSFNPRAPADKDYPPYFYNGGFEPRFALYRVWADYSSRLSLMLTGGRHVCPVAVLFSGNARQVGAYTTPEDMTSALQDALYDCDWLPFERFEDRATKIKGNEVRLHGERYRVLVVPPTEGITVATLEKVKRFFEAGGTVIGYGRLPDKSLTLGKTAADVAALREAIWGTNARTGEAVCQTSKRGGRSYFLPEKPDRHLLAAVLADAKIAPLVRVVEGATDGWVHALRRVDREGREVLFIANQNTNDAARAFTFHAPGVSGVPEVWDAIRGEVCSVPWRAEAGGVSFDLTLEGSESALVRFAARDAGRPARLTAASAPFASFPVLPDDADKPFAYPVAPAAAPTVSPVSGAVYQGVVTLPQEVLAGGRRAYLTCDMVTLSSPVETAATVRVNGAYAGGFIGKPCRVNITRHLQPGRNTVRVEPFAVEKIRIEIF
jgi:hypothetical protein